ncbi:hypothetical protein SAMN04490220_9091 [Rhodococcus jostii]|uniref:Uncharacterized protein n=2 Tax=Rhodococcus jostii TaxID=132919 RepID=A0A1H5MKX0_RHOJO|nr:hypothetical protein SAMN04490220_9091 [Rhodococcus jostii]
MHPSTTTRRLPAQKTESTYMDTFSTPTSARHRSFAPTRGSMSTLEIKNRIEAMFREDDERERVAATAGAE